MKERIRKIMRIKNRCGLHILYILLMSILLVFSLSSCSIKSEPDNGLKAQYNRLKEESRHFDEALEELHQEQEKIQGYLDQLNGLTNNK